MSESERERQLAATPCTQKATATHTYIHTGATAPRASEREKDGQRPCSSIDWSAAVAAGGTGSDRCSSSSTILGVYEPRRPDPIPTLLSLSLALLRAPLVIIIARERERPGSPACACFNPRANAATHGPGEGERERRKRAINTRASVTPSLSPTFRSLSLLTLGAPLLLRRLILCCAAAAAVAATATP